MTELTLFASSFLVVLLLGLQSLNVNNGHFILAALTSLGIGSMQMVMFKLAPHANWTEIAAFIGGGPLGIMASMWLHPRMVRLLKREPKEESPRGHYPPAMPYGPRPPSPEAWRAACGIYPPAPCACRITDMDGLCVKCGKEVE